MARPNTAICLLDLREPDLLAQLHHLQRVSYGVEADLIGHTAIPALDETAEELSGCGETFYGYFKAGQLIGAVSYKLDGHTGDIHRLTVHPDHFRQGIARRLLDHLFATLPEVRCWLVSTGRDNAPARRLYRSYGFEELGEEEVVPELWVTRFSLSRL